MRILHDSLGGQRGTLIFVSVLPARSAIRPR
jgi:hypothetical protein